MRTIHILSFLFLSAAVSAQTGLPSGQIEVVKDFEVRLAETPKVRIRPEAIPFDTAVRRYTYVLERPSPSITYARPDIRPLAIDPEARPAAYGFMARAGFGNPNAWLGQVSFDKVQSDRFAWGADVRYASADNKKIPLQKFSEFTGRADARYMLTDRLRLVGHLQGGQQTVHFYGAEDIPDNPESLRRRYTRIDVGAGVDQAIDAGHPIGYHAGLRVLADKDDNAVKENTILLTGGFKALLQGDIPVGLDAIADLTSLSHTEEYDLNNVHIKPHLDYLLGDLRLHLGGHVLLSPDGNAVLPDLLAEYPLIGAGLGIRAGWSGSVVKNNFHELTGYNPYLQDRLDTLTNTLNRRIHLGVSGRIGELTFDLGAGYARFQRMAFFLQDRDAPEQFRPVYDDGHYIDIEGVVSYAFGRGLAVDARFFQRFYSLEEEEKPWHRPSFGGDLFVHYTGEGDRYHVSFIVHTENGLPYRTPGGTEARLNPLVDLNLHGDYFFTSYLGGFLQLNNLANNKRERWVNYPSYGINVRGGLVLRLP